MSKTAGQPKAGKAARSGRSPSPIFREILSRTRSKNFQKYIRELVLQLCRIDTTPKPDPALMRAAEDRCFRILESELGKLNFQHAKAERRLIDPSIQNHPNYSLLHFTKTPQLPQGLSA